MRRLILITLCACGSNDSQPAGRDLSVNAESDLSTSAGDLGADLSVKSCGMLNPSNLPCCANDVPQHGACRAGDECIGFELYCQCMGGQWCCRQGAILYDCSSLAKCWRGCGQDVSCRDDCDQHANQNTVDLLQAVDDCFTACLAADGGAPMECLGRCATPTINCNEDQLTCSL